MSSRVRGDKGFTIIELLIATTVLSVILLLVTVIITSIGNVYYKGINQSRLQDNVRNITNELTEHLQVNDVAISTGSKAYATGAPLGTITMKSYCINGFRYSYYLNTQIGSQSGQLTHVLYRDVYNGTCVPVRLDKANPELGIPAADRGTDGVELMDPDTLLTVFTITPTSPYTMTIGMAFTSYTAGGPSTYLNLTGVSSTCKVGKNDDFCATASLITTVVQRIT